MKTQYTYYFFYVTFNEYFTIIILRTSQNFKISDGKFNTLDEAPWVNLKVKYLSLVTIVSTQPGHHRFSLTDRSTVEKPGAPLTAFEWQGKGYRLGLPQREKGPVPSDLCLTCMCSRKGQKSECGSHSFSPSCC